MRGRCARAGVSRQLVSQHRQRVSCWGQHVYDPGGIDPDGVSDCCNYASPDDRRFATAGRANHRQEWLHAEALEQSSGHGLAAKEALGISFIEQLQTLEPRHLLCWPPGIEHTARL